MNVLYSVGFAYGVAVVALAPVVVLVLLVPPWRRRLVTGPLRRRLARRRPAATMRITLPYTVACPYENCHHSHPERRPHGGRTRANLDSAPAGVQQHPGGDLTP